MCAKYSTPNRLGTGLKDNDLSEISKFYHDKLRAEKPEDVVVRPRMKPDYWLVPSEVWEVGFQEFTISPLYEVGKEKLGRGVSLRFPKLLRRRQDKALEQATTVGAVLDMYMKSHPEQMDKKTKGKAKSKRKTKGEAEDE